ncbi:hypothetical protein [Rhodococcus chondri]|uniref:Uncharacterized protein n=1 Tax=Rhodococcus chondri TaxID=3065941 RepID=A0ABU7JM42_9NOCA|nr:hypothetical protein [Rhodococcus sp. CC-R104]MEE2030924.1 hypothetical protein [Rhodococcus sp. CC-R104]
MMLEKAPLPPAEHLPEPPVQESSPPRPVSWLLRRWPTLVAVALVGPDLIGGGENAGGGFATFGQTLPMLALIYLLMAKIGKRWATWPIVLAVAGTVAVTLALDVVTPSAVLIGASLLLLVWVTITGELHASSTLRLQALGVVLFCGLAITGLVMDPEIGTYVIAAGWFLHGIWDFVHLWRDRVVSRTFAEWCGVFDVLIAVQLLLL